VSKTATKFGTFGGVFTPCTLTILGVIMFLRFGNVVGQSGVINAMLIVLAAKIITTLTTLSLSAIATNTRVRGGGVYFLISRSLGVEFGGAIGIVFFLAQAISVSMYVIGFTEAFSETFPGLSDQFKLIASIVNLAVFACVYIGAGWTIKVQYFILAILVAAITSFVFGATGDASMATLKSNMQPDYARNSNIFTMFALFFPAVTGIMAGANMSGDLAKPSRSIPVGTISAVLVTGAVYLGMALLLGASRTSATLISNNMIVRDIALWPILITAGVFAATLSSALGSMMGAPRILQAFARDDVFSSLKLFAAGSGVSGEPRRATVLTFVIAQICIMLGDLNAIAPVITMFFLITYGLLNLATFYEGVTHNPSYRPTFRFNHWSLSLIGALGCLAVMFLINWIWALCSMLVIGLLHGYIRSREIKSRWGDLKSGIVFERARKALLRLEEETIHPKNWRPVIMALTGVGWTRSQIPIYGHWLTSGNGILTLAHIVTGATEDNSEKRDRYEKLLRSFIDREELQAFPALSFNEELADGVESMLECHGIGSLRPNTVLMGWPRDESKAQAFGEILRLITRMNRSVLSARFLAYRKDNAEMDDKTDVNEHWMVPRGSIDVWWRGNQNGPLLMLLAHLLRKNTEWRGNQIRVLRVVEKPEARKEMEKHLVELQASSRITFTPVVIATDQSVVNIIQSASAGASLVLFGFEVPEEGKELELFRHMEEIAGNLPRVLFVRSAGGMALES